MERDPAVNAANERRFIMQSLTNAFSTVCVFQLAVMAILLACAIEDIKRKRISVIYPAVLFALTLIFQLYLVYEKRFDIKLLAISLIPGIVMLIISFLSDRSLGAGDGIMTLFMGPILGARVTIIAIVIALFLSAFVSGFLIIFKKAKKTENFAFIPCILIGVGVSIYAFC